MPSVLLGAAILIFGASSVAHADLTLTAGGLWRIQTRLAAVACLAGQCDSDRAQATDELVLPAGTVVQIALQIFECGEIHLPTYCELRPRRSGKVKVVRCDKGSITELLRSCSPFPLRRVTRVGGFERLDPDGQGFKWKAIVSFTARVQGQTVTVTVTGTVNGTLVAPGVAHGEVAPRTLALSPDAPGLVESLLGDVVGR